MNITLNNQQETIDANTLTVSDLLVIKKYTYKMIVVKINDRIIEPSDYETTIISDGDNVLVIHFFAGG
jgi:sulfur carrier protein